MCPNLSSLSYFCRKMPPSNSRPSSIPSTWVIVRAVVFVTRWNSVCATRGTNTAIWRSTPPSVITSASSSSTSQPPCEWPTTRSAMVMQRLSGVMATPSATPAWRRCSRKNIPTASTSTIPTSTSSRTPTCRYSTTSWCSTGLMSRRVLSTTTAKHSTRPPCISIICPPATEASHLCWDWSSSPGSTGGRSSPSTTKGPSRACWSRTSTTSAGSLTPSGRRRFQDCVCWTLGREPDYTPIRKTTSSTTKTSAMRTCPRAGTTTGAETSSCWAEASTTVPTTTSVVTSATSRPWSSAPGYPIWANISRKSASTSVVYSSPTPDPIMNSATVSPTDTSLWDSSPASVATASTDAAYK